MSEKTKEEAEKRIKEELEEINNNPDSIKGISIKYLNENDAFKWQISLEGPEDTPYKGGVFILIAEFPEDYPNHAPIVYFRTPIYHVNVNYQIKPDHLGHFDNVYLDWWQSNYKMNQVFKELLALIKTPNEVSVYGYERGEELRNNKILYEEKIKYFTKKFASPKDGINLKEYEEDWNFNI